MICVIDYDAGNTASVVNVLESLNTEYVVSKTEKDICNSEKIIFPGVGEASFAVRKLHLFNLYNLLRIVKKPILGICLGMQLFCENSKEGNVACLGQINTTVEKFDSLKVKVPHMGWNKVEYTKPCKLFEGIGDEEYFYFANSYYVPLNDFTVGKVTHGHEFSAAINKGNVYGVQFHPEKSGEAGIQIIRNFIDLC